MKERASASVQPIGMHRLLVVRVQLFDLDEFREVGTT